MMLNMGDLMTKAMLAKADNTQNNGIVASFVGAAHSLKTIADSLQRIEETLTLHTHLLTLLVDQLKGADNV